MCSRCRAALPIEDIEGMSAGQVSRARASGRVVTAGMPGVAAQHPPDGLGESFEEPVFLQGTDRVAATARLEATDGAEGGEEGAEGELIDPDGQDQQADGEPAGP